MKRIGTIFILVTILIGIFIVPINAIVIPDPGLSFGVQNNFLKFENFYTDNCTISLTDSGGLQITTSGNGNTCNVFMANLDNSLSLSAGTYRFGFVREQVYNFRINLFFDGVSEYLSSNSSSTFSINSPTVAVCFIQIPASMNSAVQSFSCLPYLIYDNNSIGSITGAFSSVIQSPFTAIASGFNSLSDQIIGIDNLITPFGTVLVFIVSIPIIVWGLNTLIGFLTRPFKRR